MSYKSVWDAIEQPDAAEHMKARSAVLIAINQKIEALGLTQAELATQLGVSRPRISELKGGKINEFSLDKLVDFAALLGLRVDVQVSQAV